MAKNLATRVKQFGFASQAVTSVNSRKLATSVKFSFSICKLYTERHTKISIITSNE